MTLLRWEPATTQSPDRRYFLCTACRLTARASATCCHDQPCARAFATCSSSSDSSSRRSDATAASPTAGSLLDAAAATSVASLMPSTYVDRLRLSTQVDSMGTREGRPRLWTPLSRAVGCLGMSV